MTRKVRLVLAVAALIATAAPAGAQAATCAGADVAPSASNLPKARRATLCLVNAERARRGRVALRFNRELAKAANAYAQDMVRRGFFSHVLADGLDARQPHQGNDRVPGRREPMGAGREPRLGRRPARDAAPDRRRLDALARPPAQRPRPPVPRAGRGIALGTPANGSGATYASEFGTRKTG